MRRNSMILVAILAAVGLISGCSDSATDTLGGPSDDLMFDDMAAIALETDLMMDELWESELDAMPGSAAGVGSGAGDDGEVDPPTDHVTFERSRNCPAGGTLTVEGEIWRTGDPEQGPMVVESSGTRTRTACAFNRREWTITVDGWANWDITRRRLDGQPDGLQESHFSGQWTAVRSDGQERSCEFDVTIIRDPENGVREIDGTICLNRLRHGVPWNGRR